MFVAKSDKSVSVMTIFIVIDVIIISFFFVNFWITNFKYLLTQKKLLKRVVERIYTNLIPQHICE